MDYNNQQNNSYQDNSYQSNAYPNNPYPNGYQNIQPTIPEEYRPIGMWGYLGYELLFSIPCIGFILLIVFSLGGTKNINVRNFARSYFCLLIIALVLVILILIIGAAGGGFAAVMGRY